VVKYVQSQTLNLPPYYGGYIFLICIKNLDGFTLVALEIVIRSIVNSVHYQSLIATMFFAYIISHLAYFGEAWFTCQTVFRYITRLPVLPMSLEAIASSTNDLQEIHHNAQRLKSKHDEISQLLHKHNGTSTVCAVVRFARTCVV